MARDYKREYQVAKKNKTKSYLHKYTEEGIEGRKKTNKARRIMGLKVGDKREVDHKLAISKGGSNGKSNLRIVSRKPNRKKGAK